MKKIFLEIFIVALGFLFIFGDVPSVNAQDASEYDEFTLEEITVTAQKREENKQKVPIAMEVISGDELAAMGKTNIDDILWNISNVMINNTSDGMKVTIRGLEDNNSPFKQMNVSTPTVAINVDGAYNKSNRAGLNLFDIERIEVLMGPQSTLYANTSPGGIVNVVTAAPKTDKFSASGSLQYGNFGYFKGEAMVNVPILTDKLAIRLAAQDYKRDSFISGSDQIGEHTKTGRLKTLYEPNDKLSTTVSLTWAERINGGMFGNQVRPFDTQDGHWYTQENMDAPWVQDGKVTDPWTAALSNAPPARPGAPDTGPNKADQTTKGINAEIVWDTGIGSLSIVPQYSSVSSDDQGSYEDDDVLYMVYTTMRERQKGVEARMTSDEDFFFKWILGFNWYKDDAKRYTSYNQPDTAAGFNTTSEKVRAIFVNVTYPFTDKFRGSAGYRRSWDDFQNVEVPAMSGTGYTGQSYSKPDYSVGVEYDLAPNSMVFANYATSYRVNAMSVKDATKPIPAERLKAYTVGAKNRFLENKLQVNASAYYYDYTNKEAKVTPDGRFGRGSTVYAYQVTDPWGNPYTIDGSTDVLLSGANDQDPWLTQIGAFRSIGADLSVDWILTRKDQLTFGLSYIDAKWKQLKLEYYLYWAPEYGTGSVWGDNGKDFSGMTNTFSPNWTSTLAYEHNFEFWKYGTLVPHVDIQYRSDYMLDLYPPNYPMDYQEAYYIINGNIIFTHASGKWSLNLYVKNAANYAAKNFWMNGDNSLGVTDPRLYGALLQLKF